MSPDTLNGATHFAFDRSVQKERSPRRSSKEKPLPPARMAVSKQLECVRAFAVAYGRSGQPVSNVDVANILGMHVNNALAPNTFLAALGLLTKVDGGHVPSSDAIAFARAHEWNAETAGRKLAPVMEKSWFGQVALPLVSLRPRDEAEVLLKLADAAEAGPEARPQLRMTLEYLEAVGLIARENGTVRLLKSPVEPETAAAEHSPQASPPAAESQAAAPENASAENQDQPPFRPKGQAKAQEPAARTFGGVQFSVSIDVSMEKVSGWSADRIEAFFTGLAKVIAAEKGICDKMSS